MVFEKIFVLRPTLGFALRILCEPILEQLAQGPLRTDPAFLVGWIFPLCDGANQLLGFVASEADGKLGVGTDRDPLRSATDLLADDECLPASGGNRERQSRHLRIVVVGALFTTSGQGDRIEPLLREVKPSGCCR